MAQRTGHDVVVVGAGVIGLACAWRCAQRGLRSLVLEREPVAGAGASGVAAGMLAPVTEAEFGEERAARAEPRGRGDVAGVRRGARARRLQRERRARGRRRSRRRRGAAPPARVPAVARARRALARRRASAGGSSRACRLACRAGSSRRTSTRSSRARVVRALVRRAGGRGELRFGVEVAEPSELDAEHVIARRRLLERLARPPVKGQILRLRRRRRCASASSARRAATS